MVMEGGCEDGCVRKQQIKAAQVLSENPTTSQNYRRTRYSFARECCSLRGDRAVTCLHSLPLRKCENKKRKSPSIPPEQNSPRTCRQPTLPSSPLHSTNSLIYTMALRLAASPLALSRSTPSLRLAAAMRPSSSLNARVYFHACKYSLLYFTWKRKHRALGNRSRRITAGWYPQGVTRRLKVSRAGSQKTEESVRSGHTHPCLYFLSLQDTRKGQKLGKTSHERERQPDTVNLFFVHTTRLKRMFG